MRALAVMFVLGSSGCAHGIAIEKIDGDTYRITCSELALDRCLAETVNNTCDKRAYFVARGISEVNQRGRSDAPDVSLSSAAVVRCGPGQGFGDQAKALMAGQAEPAAAPSPPLAPLPAAAPPPASVCAPGSTQACTGAGACHGGQACKADASGYEPCDCGSSAPTPPPEAPLP